MITTHPQVTFSPSPAKEMRVSDETMREIQKADYKKRVIRTQIYADEAQSLEWIKLFGNPHSTPSFAHYEPPKHLPRNVFDGEFCSIDLSLLKSSFSLKLLLLDLKKQSQYIFLQTRRLCRG